MKNMKNMKKITLLWVFGFIFLNMLFARENPQGEGDGIDQHYTAGVVVKDVNGKFLSGIRVTVLITPPCQKAWEIVE